MMRYSTFTGVLDNEAKHVEETWDDFVARMSRFVETDDKKSVGLFCPTSYGGSGRRLDANAEVCNFLVLDFDNCVIVDGHKQMVDVPVTIELAQAFLDGYEYVLVTSHSHTEDWPRFRACVKIDEAVPVRYWAKFAQKAVEELGFDAYSEGLDKCYKKPVQIYYWPSHPKGVTPIYYHGEGQALAVNLDALRPQGEAVGTPVPPRAVDPTKPLAPGSLFTEKQIKTYWAHELPAMEQTDDTEWKTPCPLHNKTPEQLAQANRKFYVNRHRGVWKCWSNCAEGENAGDIYRYHMLKYGMTFPEAKQAVAEIIGGEPGANMTTDELKQAIEKADAEDFPAIYREIAKQPTKAKNELKRQMVTTHQLAPEKVSEEIKAAGGKVTQFRNRNEEMASFDALESERAARLNGEPDEFGLRLDPFRYEIDETGVHQMKLVGKEIKRYERIEPPIAIRPIWPNRLGNDLATGRSYIELAWKGKNGRDYREWLPDHATNSKDTLMQLDSGPVHLANVAMLSQYLDYAKTAIYAPVADVTTQTGWLARKDVDGEIKRRFVLPGDPEFEYIGPPVEPSGTIEGWASALPLLLEAGTASYTALAVLGLAAASPFPRLIHKRNPIIGLVSDSSTGKGTIVNYGLSIWGDPSSMTVPAGSTVKGAQDLGINRPDFPMFVDELQQLLKREPHRVEDLVYFMGNGQRRTTSSRAQIARGGERRYGVSFFAAEDVIMDALQRGAQNRVVELQGVPVRDAMTAAMIQRAASKNAGTVGHAIAEELNHPDADFEGLIEITAFEIQSEFNNLAGDDPYTIAFVVHGLRLLSKVTGFSLPADEVGQWLAMSLGGNRAQARDGYEAAFVYLMEALLSSNWTAAGSPGANTLSDADGFIAWRRSECGNPAEGPMEINPTARKVIEILKMQGHSEAIARTWAKRGWIVKQGPNLKWPRRDAKTGLGARVWRISPAGLAVLGLNPEFEPIG